MPAIARKITETLPLTLHVAPALELSDEELFELCAINRDLRIERTAEGDLIMMSPAGGQTSHRNALVTMQLGIWARRDGSGLAFDSSGGFLLPNGAMRAPDAAWVETDRLAAVPPDERARFLPLCPTFVIEIRSPSDKLPMLREKLEEYLDNGARLGWLVDPIERRVHVYRPGKRPKILSNPATVEAAPELPGFVLELDEIWDPGW